MGLLDDVIGGVLGNSAQGRGGNSAIADALSQILAPQQGQRSGGGGLGDLIGGLANAAGSSGGLGGGLGGLLESLTRAGHGDVANSWVGTGPNKPIAPNQLDQALDKDTVDTLAQRTGLSRDELLRQLAQHLPNAVDRLTPDGQRPTPQAMNHW